MEGPIDYPITDKEFEAAINKLKASKSPGIDNVLKGGGNKNRKGSHERAFSTLFNRILDTGKYPALWSFGLIVPIHKRMIDPKSKITEVSLCSLRKARSLHQSSTIDCTSTWFKKEF